MSDYTKAELIRVLEVIEESRIRRRSFVGPHRDDFANEEQYKKALGASVEVEK